MTFQPARQSTRHRCEHDLPATVSDGVKPGDRWKCPTCRRRWSVLSVGPCVMSTIEGTEIKGPDHSKYWRPYRGRFIGGIGLGS